MYLGLYILLVIYLLTTVCDCEIDKNELPAVVGQIMQRKSDILRLNRDVQKANKERSDTFDETKFFNNIYENVASSTLATFGTTEKRKDDMSVSEIKEMLLKLLEKVSAMEKEKKRTVEQSVYTTSPTVSESRSTSTQSSAVTGTTNALFYIPKSYVEVRKRNEHTINKRQRWDRWTDWSACSVTCGKGREIRWRHCLEVCEEAETEMEEKACQLPACGPGKIFGIQF